VSKLNPSQTLITSPENVPWKVPDAAPPDSVAEAVLAGGEEQDGAYMVLMKWYPGWMSAPHTYATDRLCVVISGVWWCNSGPDFDPAEAVRVHPGGFVRRVAGTPHYDGARADAAEPAVIAVSGVGPVRQAWVDPSQPVLRRAEPTPKALLTGSGPTRTIPTAGAGVPLPANPRDDCM
jgi:hypothetical protein